MGTTEGGPRLTDEDRVAIESVMRRVGAVVRRKQVPRYVEREDLLQYVLLSVCEARLRWHEQSAPWGAYAWARAEWSVLDYLRECGRQVTTRQLLDGDGGSEPFISLLEELEHEAHRRMELAPRPRRRRSRPNHLTMTSRRIEVLELVWDGLTNEEIAGELEVSIKTVEKHRGAIAHIAKTGKLALVLRWGVNEGYLTP